MKTTDEKLFFRGRYSYRRPGVLIASLFLLVFGFVSIQFTYQTSFTKTWSLISLGAMTLHAGITGMCLFLGMNFFVSWFGRKEMNLEITNTGITYGGKFRPWNEIRWISGHSTSTGVTLFYQAHMVSFDRHLLLDKELAPAAYDQLIKTLETELRDQHPNIIFG